MSANQEASEIKPSDLEIELYRSLKQESASYIEKVPALWLQKFVLIGAIVAFIFTEKNFPQENLILTAAVLGHLYGRLLMLIAIGAIVCGVYLISSVYVWNLIWPRH